MKTNRPPKMPLVEQVAVDCGIVIEKSKIKAHEVPVVIGALILALSDHTGVSLPVCQQMVNTAASTLSQAKKSKSN
jgi:hypothetical protein